MNLHEIDLRHLLALIAVEHEGSFGRAGERLGFSQSAISQQIAALERVVGRSMFDRPKGPRKITLTDAGKVMLNHAEAIVEQLRNADAELLELDSREAGTVRIGSFQSVSVALLPPTLVRIRRDRPSVVVVPSEIDDDEEMRRLLAAGDLDMAFLVGDADGRFDVIHVLTDPFCLIAPRSMDFGPTVNADLLRGMAMVGELPSSCQTHVEQGLIALGVDPEFVFRSGDNGAIQSMVRAGMGVAVVPSLAVELSDGDVQMHEIDPPVPPRVISIATRAGEAQSPALRAVIEATMIEAERLVRARPLLRGPHRLTRTPTS